MKLKLVIAVIALTTLYVPAFGQTTAREWYNKGVTLGCQGKYDEAIQAFDKAIELNPDDPNTWFNKGIALLKQSKYDEAIKA
jgi:tetratricopeptide (TPR) repeat protein